MPNLEIGYPPHSGHDSFLDDDNCRSVGLETGGTYSGTRAPFIATTKSPSNRSSSFLSATLFQSSKARTYLATRTQTSKAIRSTSTISHLSHTYLLSRTSNLSTSRPQSYNDHAQPRRRGPAVQRQRRARAIQPPGYTLRYHRSAAAS